MAMTLSTFNIGQSKISCISILTNAKVSTLMGEKNQVLLLCWMELKLQLHQRLGYLCPKLNIMERPHSGEVKGSSQVFSISANAPSLIMSLWPQNFYITASVSIVYFSMAPKSGLSQLVRGDN